MKDLFEKYKWLFNYSNTLIESTYHYKDEWDAYRLMLFDKMYGMFGEDNNGNLILTLKGLPEENIVMIDSYSSVMLGYYMNKEHWYSIKLEEKEFSKDELQNFIKQSYELIKIKLPKKTRDLINEKEL